MLWQPVFKEKLSASILPNVRGIRSKMLIKLSLKKRKMGN
jgi:hypothetical protein